MLEEVGVQFLAFQRHVGLHVVGIFDDLEIVALRFEDRGGFLEDFGVRGRGRAHEDFGGGGSAERASEDERQRSDGGGAEEMHGSSQKG